jgi:hypothetical protein
MLNIISHYGNANQNHNEVTLRAQFLKWKIIIVDKDVRKLEL